ncbi:hypothetical protein AB0I75_36720 [Streptomyces sp. NPDC050273]|uniref:hypothetical protein n=1 Tax=Streptomyces sp. NPDC050273 TaxID=3154933 RepID=UPI00343EEA68
MPALPLVYNMLRDPTDAMARELRVRDGEVQLAREQMASIRSALGAMVNGCPGAVFLISSWGLGLH